MTSTSHTHPAPLALDIEVTYGSGTLRAESRQCQSRASFWPGVIQHLSGIVYSQ